MANNPYVNKVVFGSATLVDLTGTTATADKILQGYGAFGADGAWMDGTASGGGEVPIWQGNDDYVYLSDTVQAPVEIYVDDDGYVVLDIQPAAINLQTKSKTYTPSTSQQTDIITFDSGYDGLEEVDITINAMPSGTAGTPTATKGSVSNHQVSVTPSVTNTTGYIVGGTKTGTAVTVTASELASGNKAITQNGTNIDVVGYSTVSVDVPSSGGVTVTDVANTTGTTCVITSGGSSTPDIPLNTQLIMYGDVVSGYIIDSSTGDEMVSQWSCCSDYTEIDPTMTFSYIGYQWYYLAFYNANKNFISSIYMANDKDSVENDYAHGTLSPAKIPSTAKYVRISSYPTNPSSTQLSLIRTA